MIERQYQNNTVVSASNRSQQTTSGCRWSCSSVTMTKCVRLPTTTTMSGSWWSCIGITMEKWFQLPTDNKQAGSRWSWRSTVTDFNLQPTAAKQESHDSSVINRYICSLRRPVDTRGQHLWNFLTKCINPSPPPPTPTPTHSCLSVLDFLDWMPTSKYRSSV